MLAALAALALAAPVEMELRVDLAQAPRRLVRATLSLPAAPGPLALVYPRWIPGEHGPTGPIADLAGLRLTAAGRPLAWRRDDVDLYTIRTQVPRGASRVEVSLEMLAPPPAGEGGFSQGSSWTPELGVLSWNQLVLVPAGAAARDVRVRARLALPPGWRWGSALLAEGERDGRVDFAPVSLEELVDSPVLVGAHLRQVPIGPAGEPSHALVVAADSEEALAVPEAFREKLSRLVAEARALFGARHYARYRFLLTLSDRVAHFGLEHHQSSDDRAPERSLLDPEKTLAFSGLLPHEYVHSWNGKYRRPRGLATPDYQQPMKGSLLWVYEGLTTYLGDVLAARSGLRSPEEARDAAAWDAHRMEASRGRSWRPLADTATAASILFEARREDASRRRGVDFYDEGFLLWLEVDARIRERSGGTRSLDDFCRAFFGGASGPAEVRPYDLDDLVAALAAVEPLDWRGFFRERIDEVRPEPPLGGIRAAGWKLAYGPKPTPFARAVQDAHRTLDQTASLGVLLAMPEGKVQDVLPGSPADRAGLPSASRLVAVNGRRFTPEVLAAALSGGGGLDLLVEDADFFRTLRVAYSGGPRYPVLERDPSRPDLLSTIFAPRAR
jgi:predicted metalloprotease with PDZ domain